jgi:Phycobilisome protein
MLTLLEELVDRASGSYVDRQDLNKLEHLMFSWAERKEVYLVVQAKEKEIIDRAVSLLTASPNFPKKAASDAMMTRCRRDMTLALRYYSLGMLLQDKEMLKERFIYWQKNILQAMDLDKYQGVNFVMQALYAELTEEQADLLKPYFKLGNDMISGERSNAADNN